MSTTIITIEEVISVEPHPDADRLDVIKVLGYQVVTGKGSFEVGDHVIYFPPDIMIPPSWSEKLGVQQYLKHARMSTDTMKIQCRVAAARLRGVASYGFVAPLCAWSQDIRKTYSVGTDLTSFFGGEKYEPPVRLGGGDSEPDMPNFHRYTNIENIQRCPDRIPRGTDVAITEKIHGTHCRMGLVADGTQPGSPLEYQAGSNKLRRKAGKGLYWKFFTDNVRHFLFNVSREECGADVILFGEIYGAGVQDMQYGQTEKRFRAFDCTVSGVYVDRKEFWRDCQEYGIDVVPMLYIGEFNQDAVDNFTDGDSTFDVTGEFKGREGIVITPLVEQVDYRGNRLILKSVSVDYLNRRGASDDE